MTAKSWRQGVRGGKVLMTSLGVIEILLHSEVLYEMRQTNGI